jgi:AraC-like DNA-binding protein
MMSRSRRRTRHIARVIPSPIAGVYSTHIDSGHHFGRHWHNTYGFGFLEHGAQAWWSGRGNVCGYPGDVISTNPGEVHDGQPVGQPTRRWRIVYMDVGVMMNIIGRQGQHTEISRPVIHDESLIQQLRRLFSLIERWDARSGIRKSEAVALALEEALTAACTRLMVRHGSTPAAAAVPAHDLTCVRDRLADELADPPRLADMAKMTGLSRYQVLRRFEQAYGLPPHAWLIRCRAERVRLLIRDGVPIATAAAACGFADQSHMTRVFVRQFGFTPGAWRKASTLQ